MKQLRQEASCRTRLGAVVKVFVSAQDAHLRGRLARSIWRELDHDGILDVFKLFVVLVD